MPIPDLASVFSMFIKTNCGLYYYCLFIIIITFIKLLTTLINNQIDNMKFIYQVLGTNLDVLTNLVVSQWNILGLQI